MIKIHTIRNLYSGLCSLFDIAQPCLCCRAPVYRRLAICTDCEAELPWQPPACIRCGLATETERGINTGICLSCKHSPPAFDMCQALFAYQTPVSGMIKRIKDHAGFSEARCMGQLMQAAFRQYYLEQDSLLPDWLLPVPLHPARLRQRGFNQSTLLSRHIARHTRIPVLHHACERRASTHTQRGLGASQRQRNIQGVFHCGKQAHLTVGRHIAIIDDVVTTTATVNAMSQVLRAQGAARIDIWSIARAN